MRAVNKKAAAVLNTLTDGLDAPGGEGVSHRKVSNSECFMDVVVERIGHRVYSVAHYFTQNGDAMADPEMTFLHHPNGSWYPCSIRMDALSVRRDGLVLDAYTEEVTGIRPREQKDEAVFAGTWMSNIKSQQGL